MKTKIIPRGNQAGFASLVIAIVLVLVMSLTTVGFAELMRKETRSANDRHLSSQAYYAAETGINDAATAISQGYTGTKSTCGPLGTGPDTTPPTADNKPIHGAGSNRVDGTDNNTYTCLLIDPTPKDLQYTADSRAQVRLFTTVNKDNTDQQVDIASLIVGWTPKDDSDLANKFVSSGGNHPFGQSTAWGDKTGVVRLNLTPLIQSQIGRAKLIENNYAAFLYPERGGAASTLATLALNDYSAGKGDSGGLILDGRCHAANVNNQDLPGACNVKITGLNWANYVLSLRSIYADVNVRVYAYDAAGNRVRFTHAQTVIDSTGRAQDVLRRIQVRQPSTGSEPQTDFGLETTSSICKKLQLKPTSGSLVNCNNGGGPGGGGPD
jgi:hypothetical protein